MKLYIAILNDVPDFMVPTLVAHSILGAHVDFIAVNKLEDIYDLGAYRFPTYIEWFENSFKKCTIRVNQKEFDKIANLKYTYLGHENTTLEGKKSCAIPLPVYNGELPNVLKFAKLWAPLTT